MTKNPLSFLAGFAAGALAMHCLGLAQGGRAQPRRPRPRRRPAGSDQQLKDRIRSKLGRAVSQPHAVLVEVHEGRVMLRGHVLKNEVDALINAVQDAAGSSEVCADLHAHDSLDEVAPVAERAGGPSPTWH